MLDVVGAVESPAARSATMTAVTKTELRAAAEMLRTILARVEAGEFTAPKGVVARLEGAATALEAVAQPTRRISQGPRI